MRYVDKVRLKLVLAILLFCLTVWYAVGTAYNVVSRSSRDSPALILFLTLPYSRGHPLWSFRASKTPYPFKELGCVYDQCMVTSNNSLSSVANLLIFLGPTDEQCCAKLPDGRQKCTTGGGIVYYIPKVASHNAFMFYQLEAPSRTRTECITSLDDVVNYTMTYKAQSDVVRNYGSTSKLSVSDIRTEISTLKMVRNVLWYVSNCAFTTGAKERFEYAVQLARHIDVDIYGRCTKLSDGCSRTNDSCIVAHRAQYRFYLAFENIECKEYITEKFFLALQYGNIPVVRGLPKSEYQRFAPPNSFIHVDDYSSPLELANHLRQVAASPIELRQYHAWRSGYQVSSGPKDQCKLCELAMLRPQKTLRISEWWNGETDCK